MRLQLAVLVLSVGSGGPLLDNVALAVHQLDLSALEFFARASLDLADGHLGLIVLDQEHALVAYLRGRLLLINGSVLLQREGRLGRHCIAVRCYGLLQGVGFTRLDFLHHVRLQLAVLVLSVRSGGPLLNNVALAVHQLNFGAFELFSGSGFNLADGYLGDFIDIFQIGRIRLACVIAGKCLR